MTAPIVTTFDRIPIGSGGHRDVAELVIAMLRQGYRKPCGQLWERIAEGKTR